jgi:hypothetical protein
MFIMAANCAGIVGGQLFRSDDLPYYHKGWSIIAALMSLALVLVNVLLVFVLVHEQEAAGLGSSRRGPGREHDYHRV